MSFEVMIIFQKLFLICVLKWNAPIIIILKVHMFEFLKNIVFSKVSETFINNFF